MPLEFRKQTYRMLLLTLLGLIICTRANAGLRGDLQQMIASQDSNNNNNNSSNVDTMWMKSEKATTISMDLSKSWKSCEVNIDAYGSIDTGSGSSKGLNGAIGANHGVLNSLIGGATSSDDDAIAAFKRRTIPMASRHVYIPKNEGNEERPRKNEEQKKSTWNVWTWF